jgi:hypothetical protein
VRNSSARELLTRSAAAQYLGIAPATSARSASQRTYPLHTSKLVGWFDTAEPTSTLSSWPAFVTRKAPPSTKLNRWEIRYVDDN